MTTRSVFSEVKSLLRLDRFRRFGLPLALMLVLLVLSYANIQQARTIAAQDALIHDLLQDSLELSANRMEKAKARSADFKKPDVAPAPAEPKKNAEQ